MKNFQISAADHELRKKARGLYWAGWRISRIAEEIGQNRATVQSWKSREEWDSSAPVDKIESTLEMRLQMLLGKDKKEGCDFKEIEFLIRQMERTARIKKYENTGKEGNLNPNKSFGAAQARQARKEMRNSVSDEQLEKLIEIFHDAVFKYQLTWWQAGKRHRIRNILKSRQIGATYFFAMEAFLDALESGRNQIFLSASKKQALQFRSYIVAFAKKAEVELSGDPIRLTNDAELIFLGTNSKTAQSYHGNFYFDEYFWVAKFPEFKKVAAGMASQKQYRQTYFSTPSSQSHAAYPFWTGEHYNKGRDKEQHIKVDVSHKALKEGALCDDGQWRQIVTIHDAEAGGCNLFDIDQLKQEYAPASFSQLFEAQFVDDINSVFPLNLLMRAAVDSVEVWPGFDPLSARPYGNGKVALGYDPNGGGDGTSTDAAALAVLAVPQRPGGKFLVLERVQWRGLDFEAQAAAIKAICARYNVVFMAMDARGVGQGVFQLVRQFFPAVRQVDYNVDTKTRLVLRAYRIFNSKRIEYDAGETDIAASFMAIRRSGTAGGTGITYYAGRSQEASHADIAWAIMNALEYEPFDYSPETGGRGRQKMEIF